MAETLVGTSGSFLLLRGLTQNRPFWYGTAGQVASMTSVSISKNGAAFGTFFGTLTEIGGTNNGNGWYNLQYVPTDVSTLGPMIVHIAIAGGPIDFQDLVVDQVYGTAVGGGAELSVQNTTGFVNVSSNVKQNAQLTGFPFVMTDSTTHAPKSGLGSGVTAQRSLAGGGFAPCVNPVTELSNGIYVITLAATDTNANVIMLRFTATGADDLNIQLITQP